MRGLLCSAGVVGYSVAFFLLSLYPTHLYSFTTDSCTAAYSAGIELSTDEDDGANSSRILDRIRLLLEEQLTDPASDGTAGSESSSEQLSRAMEYFEMLLEHPLKINCAGRGELEQFILLSGFQIESIIHYRSESGDILSGAELSLLHGFDSTFVAAVRPFVSFERSVGKGVAGCRSSFFLKSTTLLNRKGMYDPIAWDELEAKPDSRYLGTPYSLQLRYRFNYGNRVEASFTIDNDKGERLFPKGGPPVDFFSMSVAVRDIGPVKSLVAGDFSIRLGQGLVLWNSFVLQGDMPSSLYRRGSGVVPYGGSDECGFFRGGAASFAFGRFDVSAFFSHKRVDARIKDGGYTSLVTDGIHNTLGSLEYRKSMMESLGGITVSALLNKIHLECAVVAYGFDRHNNRSVKPYNMYQIYDGVWGNGSFYFYSVLGRYRLFGECAVDYGGSGAVLAGCDARITDKLGVGLLFRSYSKSYIAPYASAYSTLSCVSNQTGGVVNLLYQLSGYIKLTGNLEYVHYPWVRYGVDAPSAMVRGGVKFAFERGRWCGYMKLSERYNSCDSSGRLYLKSNVAYRIAGTSELKLHWAFVNNECSGVEFGTEFKYRSVSGRFSLVCGVSWYDCMDWESRIYLYESDLPYTYNSRLLYGNGLVFNALFTYNPWKNTSLYIKNGTLYHFDERSESQSEMKLALKVSF